MRALYYERRIADGFLCTSISRITIDSNIGTDTIALRQLKINIRIINNITAATKVISQNAIHVGTNDRVIRGPPVIDELL